MSKKIKNITVKVKTKTLKSPEPVMPYTEYTKKVTGFERCKKGEKYYINTMFGDPNFDYEDEGDDNAFYLVANYYSDKSVAEWCRRSDILQRQMRRWAAEQNNKPMNWEKYNNNNFAPKYSVKFVPHADKFFIDIDGAIVNNGSIYFNTKEIAKLAIEKFGDEIKWVALNRPQWF